MVILCLSSTPVFGGPEKYIINMSASLGGRGHRVVVASSRNNLMHFTENKIKAYPLFIGPKLSKRNVLQLVFSPLMIVYLIRMIYYIKRRENIDLIYATYKKEQIIGTLASKLLRIPMVWREAGPLPSPIPDRKIWRLLYCWFANQANKIIATCKSARDSLMSIGVRPDKVSLVYTGIDLDAYVQRSHSDRDNRPTIGIVGRLSGLKGHDELIKAMSLVAYEIPEILLLIVGDGPEKQRLQKMVCSLSLESQIEFIGHVSNIIPYLSKMDVFVLPSQGEGLPLSIIEAMACGLPVIATNVGGIPDLVIQGKTGLLLSESTPDSLSEAIIKLIKNPELSHAMGNKGRQRAQKYFSSDRWIYELEKIFEEAI